MVTAAIVIVLSAHVTDAGGLHPLKPIAQDAAEAIANECNANPFHRYPWLDGYMACAALYTFHSFRESNWNLLAVGDHGLAHGPFQVWGRAPVTWKDACEQFTRLLHRASVCNEPLEMLAAGKCGTVQGSQISRVRTRGAIGVLLAWYRD